MPDTAPQPPQAIEGVELLLDDAADRGLVLAYLRGLLRHDAGVMFARSAVDGRLLMVNPGFEKLTGLPTDEILGRTSAELFSDAVDAAHRATDELVLRDGRAHTVAETALDGDGTLRHFVSHKFPLYGPNGEPYAVGGLAVDVTDLEAERRESRLARMAAESRFRAVFENAPVGQVFSGMDGVITEVNAALAEMLGYTPTEMIGHRALDFVVLADRDRTRDDTQRLRGGEVGSVGTTRHFLHRDGHKVLVRIVSALLPGTDGGPDWWASMVVDLSEEERARDELNRAHAATVQSADRLRLLHSIATAANEAKSLDELAPRVLASVCTQLGWDDGALVQWEAGAERDAHCRHVFGTGALAAEVGRLDAPAHDAPTTLTLPGGRRLLVIPLASNHTGPLALLFADCPAEPDARQQDVLSLISSECSRVIEREEAGRRLFDSEARFRTVFDSSPLAMGISLGETGTYFAVNEALCRLVGRTREELIGASAREIIHPDDTALADPAGAAALAAADGRHSVEMRLVHSSGAGVIANITLMWMAGPDGTPLLLAQMEDITARRQAEDALRQQAERDSLTGLANRSYLARALAEMSDDASDCAILFIDLDGFKLINDTRGHDAGDEVLVEVATRLRAAVRPTDLVARFGGDEFVVVCRTGTPGSDGEALTTARGIADRIETTLAAPIQTHAGTARITASIGIAGHAVVPGAPHELLQRADTAMYRAKRLGKDRRAIYDASLHEETVEYQRTAAALRNALAEHRFVVHYQPIVTLQDATVVGFEALVRLYDESGQLVQPDRFITVAEQSRLIVPMGSWVLQEACRTIARLRKQSGRDLIVSVNVAAQQAARSDLASTVAGALAGAGLPASALTLELTESALLDADEATLQQLTGLRERGVLIALDDFGTGYSSLTYLRRLPVSHVKVDRSFVRGLTTDPGDAAIVRAVVNLASDLGLFWVAEGIETREQWSALSALGGRGYGQGYLFSRPVPEADLPALLGLAPRQLVG